LLDAVYPTMGDGTNSLELGHKLLNYFRVRLPRVSFQKHRSSVLTISILSLCFVSSSMMCFDASDIPTFAARLVVITMTAWSRNIRNRP
jgi:hypothetical protein